MHTRAVNSSNLRSVQGRFISQDSYKGSAYEPWTQNLYTYTGNNPVNMIDPTGYYGEWIDGYHDTRDLKDGKLEEHPATIIRIKRGDFNKDSGSGGGSGGGLELTDNMKDAGVEIIEVEGEEYFDYTTPLTNLFIRSGEEAEKHPFDLTWFYNQVNHEAPWDIKVKASWEETINLPYPGSFDTIIYFNGDLTTPENLGNNLYGYTGRAAGYLEPTLFIGSRYAAGLIIKKLDENEKKDRAQIRIGIAWYVEGIFE